MIIFLQLIDDKKSLSEKCEQLVKELKTIDKKYQDKLKYVQEWFVLEYLNIIFILQTSVRDERLTSATGYWYA